MEKTRYRTVFVRDTHLGTRGCKAVELGNFLARIQCDTLYLIGDIIDFWKFRRGWYWPKQHSEVIRHFLRMRMNGTRLIYVPGNHDDLLRNLDGVEFGGLRIDDSVIHECLDGRRLWITHGDQFDPVVRNYPWLGILGTQLLDLLIQFSRWLRKNKLIPKIGKFSLANYVADKGKANTRVIDNFEQAITAATKHKRLDGVVCGHTHQPKILEINGVVYYNDGDWVDSKTALVEHVDGRFELIRGKS